MHVDAYVRTYLPQPGEDVDSCAAAAQLDRIDAYVQFHDIQLARVHEEARVSAAPGPAVQINAAHRRLIAGEVGLLVIATFAALGANTQTRVRRLGRLGDAGQLVCVDEGLDSRYAPHRLALNTLLAVARVDGRFREPAPWS
jgi:hypothetical protein